MPKLSIIIPFNNGEKYLEKCLESIKNIRYEDYEIILIDDFSKDNSKEIARKYKNTKYFYSTEETIGVGNARNLGIEKSTGKYIMFLDVDDTIENNLLKKLDKFMVQDVEMIKYKMKIIGEKEVYADGPIFDITDGEDGFNKLCFEDKYIDSPCLYLIKKELFERTNMKFEKNVFHEDFGLIPILLANARTTVSTDIYGYNYFQSHNSIMRNENYSIQLEKINDKFILYDNLKLELKNMNLKSNTCENLLEYYTNSIILGVNDLKKDDRKIFMKKIKEKSMLNNLKVRNIKQVIKKWYLKYMYTLF